MRKIALGICIGLLIAAIPSRGSAYSLRLTHRVDEKVRATNSCRPFLGLSPFRVHREYARRGSGYRRWALRVWDRRADRCWNRVAYLNAHPSRAVAYVFGRVGQAGEALRVVRCESNFWPYARNGIYWGLYQMSPYARARYGHSWTALGQSWSALAYWRDSGWSPWECA